jgi:hypothetical protein
MRLKYLVSAVGVAVLVGGTATSVFATSTISPSVVSNTAATSVIHVNSTNLSQTQGNLVIYQQCWRSDADPLFNQTNDCSNFTQDSANINLDGTASHDFTVFNGDEFNFGEWGCGPLATAPVVSQTCYVRVVPNQADNVSLDEFYPFTYGVVTPPDVPEVPLNVLLPISAAGILGAGFLVARKRHNHTAA